MTIESIEYNPLEDENPFQTGTFICTDVFREEDDSGEEQIIGFNVYYEFADTIGIACIILEPYNVSTNEISKTSFNRIIASKNRFNYN